MNEGEGRGERTQQWAHNHDRGRETALGKGYKKRLGGRGEGTGACCCCCCCCKRGMEGPRRRRGRAGVLVRPLEGVFLKKRPMAKKEGPQGTGPPEWEGACAALRLCWGRFWGGCGGGEGRARQPLVGMPAPGTRAPLRRLIGRKRGRGEGRGLAHTGGRARAQCRGFFSRGGRAGCGKVPGGAGVGFFFIN